MSDRWAVALAGSTWAGAWLARPTPWWLGAILVMAGLAWQRPAALCVGAAILASGLGAGAWSLGDQALGGGGFDGWAVVSTDPVPGSGGSVSLDLSIPGGRVFADAYGSAGAALRPRLAGELVRQR